ncbi:hypothetical protein DFJ73DRAFT_762942 [Zopfochytrium polystomum]|nr:hypothetical protein DFJ73DRAFT_762942 [Zopfochytrium polystomum]
MTAVSSATAAEESSSDESSGAVDSAVSAHVASAVVGDNHIFRPPAATAPAARTAATSIPTLPSSPFSATVSPLPTPCVAPAFGDAGCTSQRAYVVPQLIISKPPSATVPATIAIRSRSPPHPFGAADHEFAGQNCIDSQPCAYRPRRTSEDATCAPHPLESCPLPTAAILFVDDQSRIAGASDDALRILGDSKAPAQPFKIVGRSLDDVLIACSERHPSSSDSLETVVDTGDRLPCSPPQCTPESTLRLVEIAPLTREAVLSGERRWAYVCSNHPKSTLNHETWLVLDITLVYRAHQSILAEHLSCSRQLHSRRLEHQSEDRANRESSARPGGSSTPWHRRRNFTEPALSGAFGEPSNTSRPTRIPNTVAETTEFLLSAVETRAAAVAGTIGLSSIPIWVFSKLRFLLQPLHAAPSNPAPSERPQAQENERGRDNETATQSQLENYERMIVTAKVSSFGRINQLYPACHFLGQNTIVALNRFLMRFIYDEDMERLCGGLSVASKSCRWEFFVRWDWKCMLEAREAALAEDQDESSSVSSGDSEGIQFNASPSFASPSKFLARVENEEDRHLSGDEGNQALEKNTMDDGTLKSPFLTPYHRRMSASEPSYSISASSPRDAPAFTPRLPMINDIHSERNTATASPATALVPPASPHPPPRLAWVRIVATSEPAHSGTACKRRQVPADSGPPDLICHIEVLSSSKGERPSRHWISDSTLGPVDPEHEFGPTVNDVALARSTYSLPILRNIFSTPLSSSANICNLAAQEQAFRDGWSAGGGPSATSPAAASPMGGVFTSGLVRWSTVGLGSLFTSFFFFLRRHLIPASLPLPFLYSAPPQRNPSNDMKRTRSGRRLDA